MPRCPDHPAYDGRIAPHDDCRACDRVWLAARLRANRVGLALLVAAVALDYVHPLGTPPHTAAFFGILIAIAEAVKWALHAFASTAVSVLLAAYQFIRTGFIQLGRAVKSGLWDAGRNVAKVLRSARNVWTHVLKPALTWVNDKLLRLERWLHHTFTPVLEWINQVKKRLDAFYKTWIRPITDTINFLRVLNHTLEVFHIRILSKLDAVLSEIEHRVDAPFAWVQRHVTELENWIDRIMEGDGLFQRLTLIRSMGKFAPDWMRMFWGRQVGPPSPRTPGDYPGHEVLEDVNALSDYCLNRSGDHAAVFEEFGQMILIAASTPPDRPLEPN